MLKHATYDKSDKLSYEIGHEILDGFKSFMSSRVAHQGLSPKGTEGVKSADEHLRDVVSLNLKKLVKDDLSVSQRDSYLFLISYAYSFLYYLTLSKATSDATKKNIEDLSAAAVKKITSLFPSFPSSHPDFDSPPQGILASQISWFYGVFRKDIGKFIGPSQDLNLKQIAEVMERIFNASFSSKKELIKEREAKKMENQDQEIPHLG